MFTSHTFTTTYSLGIDCSDSGVKMLLAKKNRKGLTVVGTASMQFLKGAHVDGRIVDASACTKILTECTQTLHAKEGFRRATIVASIADIHTQSALVTLPIASADQEHVLGEAAKHIPLHPDTMNVDWNVVHENDGVATIFVMSAPRAVSDGLTNLLEAAELFPQAIESESIALARLIAPTRTPAAQNEHYCIIDLGEYRTSFMVCENDIPLFTLSLPFTGNMLTETIAKTLKLPSEEAEKTKRECGFDDHACKGALREVVRDHLNEAIGKIRIAIDEAAGDTTLSPKQIILVGGGAQLKNIATVFTDALGLPVITTSPWQHIPSPTSPSSDGYGWAVAAGLALRGLFTS